MSDYQYTPTKPKVGRARMTIWIALFGIITLLIWAYFAKIDQVTKANATVIASARTQEVQASEGGILTELLVGEGDEVKKGQLLVVLEEERAKAAFDNSAGKVAALKAKLARLNAEVFDKPLTFEEEVKKYSYMWREGGQFSTEKYKSKDDLESKLN